MSKIRRRRRHGRPRAERASVQSLRSWARVLRTMRGGDGQVVVLHDESRDWAAWLQDREDTVRPDAEDT